MVLSITNANKRLIFKTVTLWEHKSQQCTRLDESLSSFSLSVFKSTHPCKKVIVAYFSYALIPPTSPIMDIGNCFIRQTAPGCHPASLGKTSISANWDGSHQKQQPVSYYTAPVDKEEMFPWWCHCIILSWSDGFSFTI